MTTPEAQTAPEFGTCDVFVIGGGPAGATVAALLAQQGRNVVVAEKAHHPRFHIGESLLPANVELFEKLGVLQQVEAIGMPKWGVEFVAQELDEPSRIDFAESWDGKLDHAWQVRRSDLDEILFRNAATQGAHTLEGCRVQDVDFDAEGATVRAVLDDGARKQWRARFVIDASGRDTLLSNKLDAKRKNPKHNSAALFAHFREAERLPGRMEGHITIFWFPHGWFWFIPLADGTTSVGAVCWPYYLKSRDKPVKEFFADTIAMAPKLAKRLEGATLVDDLVHATGNYSYSSTRCSGNQFLMLGDAFAFIDPVFSSGVYLAMHSAFTGAEVVATALDRPREAPAAMRKFEKYMRVGPREFSWFIFRVSNPTMREFFLHPQNPFRVKEALMSMLAGDIHGDTPIWRSLRILKGIYYAISIANFRRSFAHWRQRRRNVRDLGALRGETVMAGK